ncbi:MAG: type III-B CRISPR module RAMP protein Cmr4, partial [Candidatus Aenigmarchaeota archaeon]|nr:type III-B CRISPR module RAMP protein Cmr4 [Candidatus Aenigmarchaeota archaeon]
NNKLFIEGFGLKRYNCSVDFTWAKKVGLDIDVSKVVVVHDNLFSYLVKYTTEVNARIKINQETGVVEKGALWYEELVPAETIFYGFIIERKTHCVKQFKTTFLDVWGKYYQFGGDETLGRGIAMVNFFPREG